MPFSQESLDFLFQNRVTDSREWFRAHKPDYERLVRAPLVELTDALAPVMLGIDPLLQTAPKSCISRIYRDTRFAKDKSVFRDVMWCGFMRDKKVYHGLPGFYVEVSPCGFRYGCGYYQASAASMDVIRGMIAAGDRAFVLAKRAVDGQHVFALEDTRYKRTRHAQYPEKLRAWLDQRNICASAASADLELLFSDRFADALAADFCKIAPLYAFLIEAESRKPH